MGWLFPWFGGSNRGERALLAHDFALQSPVCYTFCDRGRFKGGVRWGNKHFELTTEQTDDLALRDGKFVDSLTRNPAVRA